MRRSTYDGATMVWQYGTPHWADMDEVGLAQLRLAHDMANSLVEIERAMDSRWRELQAGVPELREADEAVERARAVVATQRTVMKRERITYRRTAPRTDSREAFASAMSALRRVVEERKAARVACAEQRKILVDQLREERRERTGKSHDQIWAARGLAWPTRNGIRRSVQAGLERVTKARRAGRPSELHFRRWQGEGSLYVQCMQATGMERRVEWSITGDHPRHKILRLRIAGPHWMEIPIVMHRPLPCPPEDVTDVQVTRRMIGGKPRLTVQFTCRVGPRPVRLTGASVAVKIGWKRTAGSIRVAEVVSLDPLPPVPPGLRSWVESLDSEHATILVPQRLLFAMGRPADIQSRRDVMLDVLRPVVVAAAADHVVQELLNGAEPARWKSAARFASLCHRLPPDHSLHLAMEPWRRRDKHLWQFEAHERDQAIACRRDAYRKIAAWLTGHASVLVLSAANYADLRHMPEVAEDTQEARGSRRQAQIAAPGELRDCIEKAARKRGVQIMYDERSVSEYVGTDAAAGTD